VLSVRGSGRSLARRLRRWVRYQYLRILRQKASPHNIALGVALGIFVGFLPIIPFQTVVVLTLAFIFRGNKVAAAICTVISNPLNVIPFYTMLYFVGRVFLPLEVPAFDPNHLTMHEFIGTGWDFFAIMCVGGVVLGIPSFFLSYFATRKGIMAYRERKAMRLLHRRKNG
jgi:uncharacterized protein (TIGR03546 family)